MGNLDNRSSDAADLRTQAEVRARQDSAEMPVNPKAQTPEQTQELLHELRTHQIELEMQNDELRRTHAELDASRARYFELYDLAPVGLVTVDEPGLILEANLTAVNLLGVARNSVAKKPFTRFIHAEDQDVFHLFRQELLKTGEPQACNLRIARSDGTELWVDVAATTAKDAAGALVCRLVMRDITERKQAEEAARRSEVQLQLIAEHSGDMISRHRPDSTFVYVSPSCERLFGYRPAELLGRRAFDFMHPDDLPRVAAIVQETLARGGVGISEYRHLTKAGAYIWVETTGRVIPGTRAGEPHDIVCVVRDISERKRAEEALHQSEERLRDIAHSVADWAWEVDENGVYTYSWNKGPEFRGPQDVIGKTPFDLLSPEDAAKARALFAEIAAKKAPIKDVENWTVLSNGERVCILTNAVPVLDDQGNLKGYRGADRDITDRKKAEKALQESHDRLQAILASLDDAVCLIDFSTRTIDECNDATTRLFGWSREELVGKSTEFLHVDREHFERFGREARAACEESGYYAVQFEMRRKDGSVFPTEHATRPLRDSDGRMLYMVCVVRDLTERKRAEEALRESEEKYRSLFAAESDSIFLVDPETAAILDVNDAACRLYGYTRDEMLRLHNYDVSAEVEETIRTTREYTPHIPIRYHKKKDGAVFPVEISTSVFSFRGRSLLLGAVRDITDRKQTEDEKARLRDQLAQAQKMESVGRLAGGVAHDFNNMLSVILGHVEMALVRVDPTLPLHADLEEIRKAANRSADLTRQLLAFARKQTVAPKILDLNETVAGVLKMLQRLIGEDINLTWRPEASLWPVRVDPSQIDQILANLCVNARDAISGVGKIVIETGMNTFDADYCADHPGLAPGEYVRLSVSDDGSGMEKQTLEHVFEPFFTTKGVGEGTGLGLATVYGAVKQNNGFVSATSEPGQGTIVTVYLPRHVDRGGQAQTAEGAAAEPAVRGQETVLLVEDEPAILKMTTVMLERLGYTVLAAGTPGEAMSLAREFPGQIHLLMTDVVMPEMNGCDLAKNLLSLYPDMKRLFMSGYTADVIAHHGVLDDGVYFIQKPFSLATLAAEVRGALEGTRGES